jgi:hypothetical protein
VTDRRLLANRTKRLDSVIPILKSRLAPYFSDRAGEGAFDSMRLLDQEEAREIWRQHFGVDSKGFHDLPAYSWAVGPWNAIGEWLGAYNGQSEIEEVGKIVSTASKWSAKEPLQLFQNRSNIVSLPFDAFVSCWTELFGVFDDGPILVSCNSIDKNAFCFAPLGQVLVGARR